jgi:hypothetical protein
MSGNNYPVVIVNHSNGTSETLWCPTRDSQLVLARGYLEGGFQVCAPEPVKMCSHVR